MVFVTPNTKRKRKLFNMLRRTFLKMVCLVWESPLENVILSFSCTRVGLLNNWEWFSFNYISFVATINLNRWKWWHSYGLFQILSVILTNDYFFNNEQFSIWSFIRQCPNQCHKIIDIESWNMNQHWNNWKRLKAVNWTRTFARTAP